MTAPGHPDPFDFPLCDRIRHGARRGALFGVYLFVVLWLQSAVAEAKSARVLDEPVTAAAAVISGCAIAGTVLLALRRRIHTLLGAVVLAIACSFPALLGFTIAVRGFSIAALPFLLLISVLLGAISGTMLWKGWHR